MKKRAFAKRNREVIQLTRENKQLRDSIDYYRERWFNARSENKRLVRKLRGDDEAFQQFDAEFSYKT